eukprot:sb/3469284/
MKKNKMNNFWLCAECAKIDRWCGDEGCSKRRLRRYQVKLQKKRHLKFINRPPVQTASTVTEAEVIGEKLWRGKIGIITSMYYKLSLLHRNSLTKLSQELSGRFKLRCCFLSEGSFPVDRVEEENEVEEAKEEEEGAMNMKADAEEIDSPAEKKEEAMETDHEDQKEKEKEYTNLLRRRKAARKELHERQRQQGVEARMRGDSKEVRRQMFEDHPRQRAELDAKFEKEIDPLRRT